MAKSATQDNGTNATNFDRANDSVKSMGNAYHMLIDIDLRSLRGDADTREQIKLAREYLEYAMDLVRNASENL